MPTTSSTKDPAYPQPKRFLWFYLPDLSLLKRPPVRIALLANFLSGLAIGTLSYGATVHLARTGATQFEIAIVSAASFLPGLVLGAQGGVIADSLPKRVSLGVIYLLQATLCIVFPFVLGTEFITLLFLILIVSTMAQVSIPAARAVVPLVAKRTELVIAAMLLSLTISTGSAIGQAFLAPILIKTGGITAVMIVGGLMLLLAGFRVLGLPHEEETNNIGAALRQVDWRPTSIGLRPAAEWIAQNRIVATMIIMGTSVSALYEAFMAMMPGFVGAVLGADPANTVFIFATIPIGFFAATFATPWLITKFTERPVLIGSVAIFASGIALFGLIELVAPLIAPFSPLLLLGLLGVDMSAISAEILAASVLIVPTYAGFTAAGATAQTYVNRRVPILKQAGTFGIDNMLKSALTITAVLSFGLLATLFSTQLVYLLAPIGMIILAVGLISFSYRYSEEDSPDGLGVLASFWDEGEETTP